MNYVWAFVIGGLICVVGQILVDKTKLTMARILVIYVCLGAFLTIIGVYEPMVQFAGAGATIPITGFGYTLVKGVIGAVNRYGLLGVLTGGLAAMAGGVTAAVVFGYVLALIFRPRAK